MGTIVIWIIVAVAFVAGFATGYCTAIDGGKKR